MLQVSRANNLKIPKVVETGEKLNRREDKIMVKEAISLAAEEKFKMPTPIEDDDQLKKIEKIPFNANDLIVVTIVKKLGTYVIAITEKSPKKI